MVIKNSVNVLGTQYRIEVRKRADEPYMVENELDGYCSSMDKLIVVSDMSDAKFVSETEKENYFKHVLRHELVHACYAESGLSDCANSVQGAWCKNEEMIDWIAYQFPKMIKVFEEAGCL